MQSFSSKEMKRSEITRANADHFLDISQEVCPMTMVRTRLLIDKMLPGETALLSVQSGEALHNIAKTLKQLGLDVLAQAPAYEQTGLYRLLFCKPPSQDGLLKLSDNSDKKPKTA